MGSSRQDPDARRGPDARRDQRKRPHEHGRAARYGSPRDPAHPMAFTGREFAAGAAMAWLLFNLAAPILLGLAGVAASVPAAIGSGNTAAATGAAAMIMVSPFYLAPWSLGAVIAVGAPAAWVIGRRLVTVADRRRHRWAFGLLGAILGAATSGAFLVAGALGLAPRAAAWWVIPLLDAVTAWASVAGWSWTSSRALRSDAHPAGLPRASV